MMRIEIQNHQNEVALPPAFLTWLERNISIACQAAQQASLASTPLSELTELDIAFIEQSASDIAHRQFMNIPGATDVITFPYGELLICPQIALLQAAEHHEPLWRELLRYVVHGMLHLAGYDDRNAADADKMHAIQEVIVNAVPPFDEQA